MKKQFNLQDWLKDKSQKVETRSGKNVRIICWDKIGVPIVALVGDADDIVTYNREGTTGQQMKLPSDLFIVTPEPELNEFEKRIRFTIDEVVDGRYNADNIEDVKGIAKGLLELAREQFIKDGYVIEKKAFHDAVENISDKHLAEMSVQYSIHCKVEDGTWHAIMNWDTFQKVAQHFIDIGRADVLKDLPRWEKLPDGIMKQVKLMKDAIIINNHYIRYSDLEKLPGFKEDTK